MADVFGFGDPTTAAGRAEFARHLKTMDVSQARDFFIKRMADIEGTTYHAKDYPGFARSDAGKWLVMFRTFRWNVAHNIWNQMTSPNYTLAHRMHVTARFLSTIPTLDAIDPIIRHTKVAGIAGVAGATLGLGVANIDSKLAYDSFHKAVKEHGSKASSDIYALFQLAINSGATGIMADMLQGWNLMNPDIFGRAVVSGNVPILSDVDNLAMATALAANGAMTGDKHEMKRAYSQALSVMPLGTAASRVMGYRPKEPRVPKKQVLKTAIQKGTRAVGLD
jgi:hypothetical protein